MTSAIHTTASAGYTQTQTANYNAVRSGYTSSIADYIITLTVPQSVSEEQPLQILDLGAGTGKWTSVLLEALTRHSMPYTLTAVDPVPSMAASFQQLLPNTPVVIAPAHKLPFADKSIDLVTAATALHWFADAASMAEIHRILKPGAYFVALMYDWSEEHDWTPAMGAYLDTFYADGTPYIKHGVWKTALKDAEAAGLFTVPVHKCFPETATGVFDREGIVNRFASASKVAALEPVEKEKARQEFANIVNTDPGSAGKEKFFIKDDVNVYSVQARHV